MHYVDEILNENFVEGDGEILSDEDLENVAQEENKKSEETDNKKDEDDSKTPKKRKIRNPQPKLNLERLKGPRGLACMESMFSDIKFKGHGHEQENLEKIMLKLGLWCHRLFPKFTFDDTLNAMERLGSKKAVMNLKKKICMGLYEEDHPIINEDATSTQTDEFDLLLSQPATSFATPIPATALEVEELSDEQKEIIAKNRLLAAERRRARLEKQQEISASQNSNFNHIECIEISDTQEQSTSKDDEVFNRLQYYTNETTAQVLKDVEMSENIINEHLRKNKLNENFNSNVTEDSPQHIISLPQEVDIQLSQELKDVGNETLDIKNSQNLLILNKNSEIDETIKLGDSQTNEMSLDEILDNIKNASE